MGRVIKASPLVACIIVLWLMATGFLAVTIPVSLAILALAPIHLHEFTGWGAACDAIAQDCEPGN